MNKEIEGLLLNVAKVLDLGVIGVDPERARDYGVPVADLVQAGQVLPGHSKKAQVTAYYCPYSVWRPPSGECLYVEEINGEQVGYALHYRLNVLSERGTMENPFGGYHELHRPEPFNAYLRGIWYGAEAAKSIKGRR